MEIPSTRQSLTLAGELFDVVKEKRLKDGMVLRSKTGELYARLGPKEATLEEQIHTVSLSERGFPVPRVVSSGAYSESEWFFTETSLGEQSFHEQFAAEFQRDGRVSDATYANYLYVVDRYSEAQYLSANRMSVGSNDFTDDLLPPENIEANYQTLGRDVKQYRLAVDKVKVALNDVPMGVLQYDLNPNNVVDGGVIDFEYVGYGPIGYDTLLSARFHRWFTDIPGARFSMAYELTPEQIAASDAIIDDRARKVNLHPPTMFLPEFVLLKTAWAFTSTKPIDEEPASKIHFYNFRAELLSRTVEAYLSDAPIDCLDFPSVRPEPLSDRASGVL